VDIVVKGRNVEVPAHFRVHVAEKLQKMERYDHKIIELSVELSHERNRRQADICQRVEITYVSRGPVIRAEACAADFYSALDLAVAKLETRLRRAADRRRVHRGRHSPVSVAEATAALAGLAIADQALATAISSNGSARPAVAVAERESAPVAQRDSDADEFTEEDDQPWHIVRMKEHSGDAMTVEDALFQMELVGHDFYLFQDKDSGRPSVVYRRRAYDYGVIALAP
jgi:ribosomal subunit interface protein